VKSVSQFASYFSRNPHWGVFEHTLGIKDYTAHVNPDYFDGLTDEERDLILIYNSLTPDERKALTVQSGTEMRTSTSE
jgi:hypothetical protein